jgi:hypothetical protein
MSEWSWVVHSTPTTEDTHSTVKSMWDIMRMLTGGVSGDEFAPAREGEDDDPQAMVYALGEESDAWSHTDLLRIEDGTSNFHIIENPLRIQIDDPSLCCVCTNWTSGAARRIARAAIANTDVRPGWTVEVARPCHPDCVNPGHSFVVSPRSAAIDTVLALRSTGRLGRPVNEGRRALAMRAFKACNEDVTNAAHMIGIRPVRLRKLLGLTGNKPQT